MSTIDVIVTAIGASGTVINNEGGDLNDLNTAAQLAAISAGVAASAKPNHITNNAAIWVAWEPWCGAGARIRCWHPLPPCGLN